MIQCVPEMDGPSPKKIKFSMFDLVTDGDFLDDDSDSSSVEYADSDASTGAFLDVDEPDCFAEELEADGCEYEDWWALGPEGNLRFLMLIPEADITFLNNFSMSSEEHFSQGWVLDPECLYLAAHSLEESSC